MKMVFVIKTQVEPTTKQSNKLQQIYLDFLGKVSNVLKDANISMEKVREENGQQ